MDKEEKKFSDRSLIYRFFFNILTSGRFKDGYTKTEDILLGSRMMLINSVVISGAIVVAIFMLILMSDIGHNLYSKSLMIMDICLLSIFIPTIIISRIKKINFLIPTYIVVTAYTIFCWIVIYTNSSGVMSPMWFYLLPITTFYLLGSKVGYIYSVASTAFLVFTFFTTTYYSFDEAIRHIGIYTILNIYSNLIFNQVEGLFKKLSYSNRIIQEERDETVVMKDGLDIGIFMLDDEGVIQPFYSKPLLSILEYENLDYVKLTDIFKNSLQTKEIELLNDFMEMLIHATSLNLKLLLKTNPLHKTKYVTPGGNEKKLDFSFIQIFKDNKRFLLVTVRDITREAEIEIKLQEEEKVRQDEMRTMFEIMHSPSDILNEYLDESTYELDAINDILKNKELSRAEILTEIYQSIHAIKSNAIIIGLETMGRQLHNFETRINLLLEKEEIAYDDMLSITFELNKILSLNDSLKKIMDKILAFSASNAVANVQKDVFTKTINSTLNRALIGTEKKASIKIKDFDWEIMAPQLRRATKEILIQLIRNSVYHGLEDSEDRIANNKNENGILTISIKEEEDHYTVEYSDDGKGIDFEKVLEKAKEKKLVSMDTTIEDKNSILTAMMSPRISTSDSVNEQAGRGVGLSLVSNRISKNKGSLKIFTNQGKGTKFVITLAKTS